MEVLIVADPVAGARHVADAVSALLERKPNAVLGLATGSSPEPVYEELARRHTAGTLSCERVRGFQLDEYVGLPHDHPQSYRSVIRRTVGEPLGIDADALFGPDGMADDIPAASQAYEDAIAAAGGVDLQLVGVGSDGHIGFNEPTSSLASRTRIKTLTRQTLEDNARFFGNDVDAVPRHVLTQGIGTILDARHVVLLAWGRSKADAVAGCVEGPVSAMHPGSALQLHPHVTVVIDEAAASRLTLADYYRTTWAAKPSWQGL